MVYFPQENAKALAEIKAKGVTIFDAPADYAPAWIKASKKVLARLEAKDPFFKKVLDSQRAFAKVVVPYGRETSKLSHAHQRRDRIGAQWVQARGGAGSMGSRGAIPNTPSSICAAASSFASPRGGPTSCSATGSPLEVNPQGRLSAGSEVSVMA